MTLPECTATIELLRDLLGARVYIGVVITLLLVLFFLLGVRWGARPQAGMITLSGYSDAELERLRDAFKEHARTPGSIRVIEQPRRGWWLWRRRR